MTISQAEIKKLKKFVNTFSFKGIIPLNDKTDFIIDNNQMTVIIRGDYKDFYEASITLDIIGSEKVSFCCDKKDFLRIIQKYKKDENVYFSLEEIIGWVALKDGSFRHDGEPEELNKHNSGAYITTIHLDQDFITTVDSIFNILKFTETSNEITISPHCVEAVDSIVCINIPHYGPNDVCDTKFILNINCIPLLKKLIGEDIEIYQNTCIYQSNNVKIQWSNTTSGEFVDISKNIFSYKCSIKLSATKMKDHIKCFFDKFPSASWAWAPIYLDLKEKGLLMHYSDTVFSLRTFLAIPDITTQNFEFLTSCIPLYWFLNLCEEEIELMLEADGKLITISDGYNKMMLYKLIKL
jgi:hypothetical protein